MKKYLIYEKATKLYLNYNYNLGSFILVGREKAKVWTHEYMFTRAINSLEYNNAIALDNDTDLGMGIDTGTLFYNKDFITSSKIDGSHWGIYLNKVEKAKFVKVFVDEENKNKTPDCYVWIARDKDGSLAIYPEEPEKGEISYGFSGGPGFCMISEKYYPEVTFETGPKKIKLGK